MGFESIVSIGFDKNGEADFRVCATIQDLSQEKMKDFRAMIAVAIGVAEDMWRRQQQLQNPGTSVKPVEAQDGPV